MRQEAERADRRPFFQRQGGAITPPPSYTRHIPTMVAGRGSGRRPSAASASTFRLCPNRRLNCGARVINIPGSLETHHPPLPPKTSPPAAILALPPECSRWVREERRFKSRNALPPERVVPLLTHSGKAEREGENSNSSIKA